MSQNFTLSTKKLGGMEHINGFHLKVTLNCVEKSPGVTTINWESFLGTTGAQTGNLAGAELFLKINAIQGSSSATSVEAIPWLPNDGWYNFYDPSYSKKVKSGSFDYYHDSSGKASFNITLDANIGGIQDDTYNNFLDTTTKITLTDSMPYTNCGAPTSVTASGIITPSGSFTVSWKGATAGHANAIKGYQVFYRITSDGSAPTVSTYSGVASIETKNTSGNYTFSLNNATRGYKIVCGVITLGDVSGYNSIIKTGGLVTINSLPDPPIVSVNKTIVPSTNNSVTFTIKAGIDKDSDQTKTFYYTTDSTRPTSISEATLVPSSWVQTIKATKTYYFWTYDGLEFSNLYSSKKIIKNTKPTFNVTISSQGLYSINNKSNYNYTISPIITLSNISGGQKDKKYTYILYYGTDVQSMSNSITISTDTTTQKIFSDIREKILEDGSTGVYYKFTVQCYDGVEYSDIKSTDIRYVTKVPSLIGIYSKDGFQKVEGFSSGNFATHYSKFLGFVFQRDAGYNQLIFKDKNGNKQTITLDTNSNDTRGSWLDSNNTGNGIKHNLSFQIGYTNGYIAKEQSQEITKISYMSLSNFQFAFSQTNAFRYFTHEEGAKNPIMLATPFPKDDYKDYGMNSKEVIPFNFYIKYSNKKSTIQPGGLTFSNDATVQFNLPAKTLVSLINDLLEENEKNKTRTFNLQLVLANAFEDSVSINTDFLVDFNETERIDWGEERFSIFPRGRTESINLWKYLTQGMKALEGNFEIKSYNTNPEGHIYIKRSTNPNVWNEIASFNFSRSSDNATPRAPAKYTISNTLVQEIGEISELEYNVSYKLKVITDSGEKEFELYNEIPVRGHRPPILSINSNTYENNVLTINYEIKDFGIKIDDNFVSLGNGNKVSLYPKEVFYIVGDKELSTFFNPLNKNKTAIFNNYEFGEEESQLAQLSITTILPCYLIKKDPDDGTEKLVLIEEFQSIKSVNLEASQPSAIFNLVPTVAYRKNHLGINILNPSENSDAIIIIGESQGRDSIYFQSSDGKCCKVINFHLDGGTW